MLRAGVIPVTALLLLAACQSPVVPVRNYTYNATFIADGRKYALSTSYQCHYEDLAWWSERGPGWHIRKGVAAIRIIGQLADGTAFEVLPFASTPDVFCSEHGGPIESQLFIATPDAGVASVGLSTDRIVPHKARLLQAALSFLGTDSGVFAAHKDWPTPTVPKQHFYRVQATYYDASLWKQDQNVLNMVGNKTIRWLDDARVWPFTEWTADDVAFARARQGNEWLNGYDDAGKRFPVALVGEAWRFNGPNNDVLIWRPAPAPPDVKHWSEPGITRWVEYDGHQIELSIRAFNRIFYEQKSQRLVEFRAVHVGLW
jgi:hypothetical protein